MLDYILIIIIGALLFLYTKVQFKYSKLKKSIEHEKESFNKQNTLHLNNEFSQSIVLDPLTGLPGQHAFDDRVNQAINLCKRNDISLGILLLDLYGFGNINKVYGSEIGDKLLIEAGKRLQGCIRQVDSMTRYAGDTFIFLLPQLSLPQTAAYVAQRLLDSLTQPFQIGDKELVVSANVGVAIFPDDGQDEKTLIKNADEALHEAKLNGEGKFQFYRQEIHTLGKRELSISLLLSSPDVLQKLLIFYYPYMNTRTNKVICIQAEACIKIPEFGLIHFGEFARIAENCKKILDIGEWLLRNAIVQFQKWQQEDLNPEFLIVNVTLSQISNAKFMYKVTQILEEYNMNPQKLIFEVSEKNVFNYSESLEKSFLMLKEMNLQISLNIYSLGHLALQKITQLPVNFLKINNKLFYDKKLDEQNDTILHLIVTLANDMEITILVEGVENEHQKDMLEELGCEIMEGKLFGEPLPGGSLLGNYLER